MNSLHQDLDRDIWCLFGIPIDNMTMDEAKRAIRKKIYQNMKTVLSTVNINWVIESLKDPAFRESVLNSDMVTIDGKPLLWISRLFGLPIKETVPGSSLIEELANERSSNPPIKIFLFGGGQGVAKRASERINEKTNGLKSVGYLNPGFGTVEEMSSNDIIESINKTNPDILLIALGAKKGNQWIRNNSHRLNAKIVSHLGATINFIAGTVQRAPNIVRKIGCEWIWRIYKEPSLLRRYVSDGVSILYLLAKSLIALIQYRLWRKQAAIWMTCSETDVIKDAKEIKILSPYPSKEAVINSFYCFTDQQEEYYTFDFSHVKFVDCDFLGLLMLLMKHKWICQQNPRFINLNDRLCKVLRLFGIEVKRSH